MAREKPIVARTAVELARALNLPPAAGREWEVQSMLTEKLIRIVSRLGLTHAQVARKAGTSRTRITSILNHNLKHVSTDLLIRILGSLGYQVNITVSRDKLAA